MAIYKSLPFEFDNSDYKYDNEVKSNSFVLGKDETNAGDYSEWNMTKGKNAETWVYYKFDFSAIPKDAIINFVQGKAKVSIWVFDTYSIAKAGIQLYCGNVAKGSFTSFTVGGMPEVLSLSPGTWTRDELDTLRFKLYAKRSSKGFPSTFVYHLEFHGASITVDYTVNSVKYQVTLEATPGGTISPNGVVEVDQNSNLKIVATPASGYLFQNLAIDSLTVPVTQNGESFEYFLTNIVDNHHVLATFKIEELFPKLFIKDQGKQKRVVKVFLKKKKHWEEVPITESLLSSQIKYVRRS